MRVAAVGSVLLGVALAGVGVTALAWSQQGARSSGQGGATTAQPARAQNGGQDMPDLIGTLQSVEGCLGVDAGQFRSGKQAIFAWFENKEAAMRWYNHDVHQGVMASFVTADSGSKPLAGVPDDVPVLAIASITYTDKPHFKEINLPISQIAIELYTPLKGGIHLGGTFAPASLKVDGIQDLAPKQ